MATLVVCEVKIFYHNIIIRMICLSSFNNVKNNLPQKLGRLISGSNKKLLIVLPEKVLSGAGVEATYYGHSLGIYLLVIAFVIAVFELVFAVNFCVALDIGLCEKVKALKLWDAILWLDDWKKGLFYILLAIPCFIQPHKVLLALISGCLVFISGMFYMIKTFKTRREKRLEMLSQKESYDRFEDLQDDMIEDDIINPNTAQPMSVADQSEILEV